MDQNLRKNELYEFRHENDRLVLCVPNGQIFKIDRMTGDVLDLFEDTTPTEIPGKLSDRYDDNEIKHLLDQMEQVGLLIRSDAPDIASDLDIPTDITDMALFLTDFCNLRCTYCYEAGKCQRDERKHMDRETAEKAVDFMIRESGESRNCTIQFFGGEPLLNFRLLKHVVRYCRDKEETANKKFGFTIDTNGTLLNDEIVDFCCAENIGVGVSLDGTKDVNDTARIFPDGSGSYDTVVKQSARLLERMPETTGARATLTKDNYRFRDTLNHLVELGFRRVLIDCDGGSNGTWSDDEIIILKEEFEKAADYFIKLLRQDDFLSFGNIVSLLPLISNRKRKRYHCGAGIWYVAVTPDGTIYPCHRLTSHPQFAMGNVMQSVSWDLREEILSHPVETKDSCQECWARYLCGGGCFYRGFVATRDPFQPDPAWCELTRHVLTLAMCAYHEFTKRRAGVQHHNNAAQGEPAAATTKENRAGGEL